MANNKFALVFWPVEVTHAWNPSNMPGLKSQRVLFTGPDRLLGRSSGGEHSTAEGNPSSGGIHWRPSQLRAGVGSKKLPFSPWSAFLGHQFSPTSNIAPWALKGSVVIATSTRPEQVLRNSSLSGRPKFFFPLGSTIREELEL